MYDTMAKTPCTKLRMRTGCQWLANPRRNKRGSHIRTSDNTTMVANIKAANGKKEEELVKIAAESLVKQEESEKVRAEKLRVKEAIVKQENAERTAVAKKRLEAHEHSLVVEEEKKKVKAEKKFAVVEVRLAKKKVKQDEEIAAARKRAADAAAGQQLRQSNLCSLRISRRTVSASDLPKLM